jgi:phosphoglycerate dehydrogenase-like enzyme
VNDPAPAPAAAPRDIRVVNVIPLTDAAKARLATISDRLDIRHEDHRGPDWVVDGLTDPDVEVLVSWYLPSDLARTPRLRWLQNGSSGVDFLDLALLREAGITVTNGSGIHAVPIAEYVLEAMLHVVRDVDARQANQRAHGWPDTQQAVAGGVLRGKTAVIVGYGSIGREVGRLADAFGVRVIAVKADPSMRADSGYRVPGTGDPEGRYPERFVGPDDLASVAREADFLVIAIPGAAGTHRLVGQAVIDALPRHAWVINVGRGRCIDVEALEAALRANRIGGAVLDVFDTEPLPPDSPLWDLPNLTITPHVSGAPPGIFELIEGLIAENLRRYVAGEPLLNVVDLTRGY